MKIPHHLLKRSRALRKKQTAAEIRLWSLLRGKKLGGYKIRRQHVILNYIVDFFCYSEKLIIELDGPIHNTQKAREYDQRREDLLKANGYRILRFKNTDVFQKEEKVLSTILSALDENHL
ncbi:MAG: endonuclease domain-containing protein [FCB group bacterium]|nr:endonuclease domain-containing protein [FCB group bacterium]MBL7027523.1 endonuclease domain-containing protein [Candidatus Neomarinimicrobiota bacterium]MBL7122136.1 endonuclease domain-containing protein [Candidatus Neomarinimicrobiota bacterium]